MKLFVSIFSDARLLPHVLRHYSRLGVDEFHVAAPPNMADEVAAIDGQPKPFDEHTDLRALFPVKARFISVIMSGVDIKGVLVKGHLKSAGAHHLFHDERPYSQIFEISHYKWFDRSLERLKVAYDMALAAGTGWENQYKTVLEHYERHGRFAWETFGGEIAGPVAAG